MAQRARLLNATVTSDPLPAVINAADPVAAWDGLELADQRLFIDRLCTVTILPAGCKGRGFDPTTLDIAPKHGLGRGSLPTTVIVIAYGLSSGLAVTVATVQFRDETTRRSARPVTATLATRSPVFSIFLVIDRSTGDLIYLIKDTPTHQAKTSRHGLARPLAERHQERLPDQVVGELTAEPARQVPLDVRRVPVEDRGEALCPVQRLKRSLSGSRRPGHRGHERYVRGIVLDNHSMFR